MRVPASSPAAITPDARPDDAASTARPAAAVDRLRDVDAREAPRAGLGSTPATPAAPPSGAPAAGGLTASLAAARTRLEPALLLPYRPAVERAIEALARACPGEPLRTTLELLAPHPLAERAVVAALTGASPYAIDDAALAAFSGRTVDATAGRDALAAWVRREETIDALAGHTDELRALLGPALAAEPDWGRWRRALATVARAQLESASGSHRLAGLLTARGALPVGADWRTSALDPGVDVIGLLAGAPVDDARVPDDALTVARADAAMQARGLYAEPKWAERRDLSVRRGMLGEALRLDDVEREGHPPTRQIVQGVLVLETPPALWAASTRDEAIAIATALGLPAASLMRHVTPDGAVHFGILHSEIDVALFDVRADGAWAPVRLENVKAGAGSAHRARAQNELARRGASDPGWTLLFPREAPGPYGAEVEVRPLDRSPETLAALVTVAVGPREDPRYDVHLPLTGHDLTALALTRGARAS